MLGGKKNVSHNKLLSVPVLTLQLSVATKLCLCLFKHHHTDTGPLKNIDRCAFSTSEILSFKLRLLYAQEEAPVPPSTGESQTQSARWGKDKKNVSPFRELKLFPWLC